METAEHVIGKNDCLSHSPLTLDLVPVGSGAVVESIQCANTILRNKLLSMGLVKNTPIIVLNVAPLGDPMTIQVLGTKLSLRLSEARSISVSLRLAAA